ncbi:GNAT family N-acetyltransferase [Noviherbaspirillum aerium]|uniref:GNAT family N-acetyltransferase n=1 Tax=Noviherbaspirillum aerium TaxID=2588497 RepID=UPI00124D41C0|nr:GNAT family N-acetyltransferase [Noviherbaspirillum aerium]
MEQALIICHIRDAPKEKIHSAKSINNRRIERKANKMSPHMNTKLFTGGASTEPATSVTAEPGNNSFATPAPSPTFDGSSSSPPPNRSPKDRGAEVQIRSLLKSPLPNSTGRAAHKRQTSTEIDHLFAEAETSQPKRPRPVPGAQVAPHSSNQIADTARSPGEISGEPSDGIAAYSNPSSASLPMEIVADVRKRSADEFLTDIETFRKDIYAFQADLPGPGTPEHDIMRNRLGDTHAVLDLMMETCSPTLESEVSLTCFKGTKPIGLATVTTEGDDPPYLHINQMVTHPEYFGVGANLLTRIVHMSQALRQSGNITLMPKNDTVAAIYEKQFGFQHMDGDYVDYMILRPENMPDKWQKDSSGQWQFG